MSQTLQVVRQCWKRPENQFSPWVPTSQQPWQFLALEPLGIHCSRLTSKILRERIGIGVSYQVCDHS